MNLLFQSIFVALFAGVMVFMAFAISAAILTTVNHFYGPPGLVVFIIFVMSVTVGVVYYKSHLKD